MKEQDFLKNFAKILGAETKLEEIEKKKEKERRLLDEISKHIGVPIVQVEDKYLPEDFVAKVEFVHKIEEVEPIVEEVVEEPVAELVEEKPVEEIVENVIPPMPELPKNIVTKSVEKISKAAPQDAQKVIDTMPDSVRKELDIIKKSVADFHRFAQRHSQMGGGGEVNLRYLDDVDRSSIGDGKYLAYNAATKKFTFVTLTGGGTEVDTLDTVTTRGNTTNNSIFVYGATANYFAVNTSTTHTVSAGEIAWNASDLTFDMGLDNGIVLQVGQEQLMKVKAYEAITIGQAVMFAGVNGEHIQVRKYDPTVAGFIPEWYVGVATQTLTHNEFGYVTIYGKVHNVNTLAWSAGDILYAGNGGNPGALTNIEPTDPSIQIIVAVVTKVAGGDGHIFVRPTWRDSLHLLSDVTLTSPANGQVLMYVSSSNTWTNQTISGFQTTAGLSANVATLTSNNTLYLDGVAANQYAYANGSNFNVNNSLTLTYAGATPTGYPLIINSSNTEGGSGYSDFLKVTNKTAGATANNKSFRLNSTGAIEIINSAYSATILSLTDTGGLSVPGPISISGKQAVNGPVFSAYANNTLQTITSGSLQKVLFQVEEFDTNNNYASSRFTPTVEGYYQLNAEVRLDGSSGVGEMMIVLYKNGAGYKRGTNQSGTLIASSFWAMQVSSVVYANGTTDYFEIYVQQGSGVSVTVTAVNDPSITWFNGCMLRGA